jgi:hypothetical protein
VSIPARKALELSPFQVACITLFKLGKNIRFFVRPEAFLRPDLQIVQSAVRSRSQGWPKATAAGGA